MSIVRQYLGQIENLRIYPGAEVADLAKEFVAMSPEMRDAYRLAIECKKSESLAIVADNLLSIFNCDSWQDKPDSTVDLDKVRQMLKQLMV